MTTIKKNKLIWPLLATLITSFGVFTAAEDSLPPLKDGRAPASAGESLEQEKMDQKLKTGSL
jgi:hypothetical protein